MRRLALLLLFAPSLLAQVQIQGKPGGAVQIGGNQPGVSSIQGATGDFTYTGSGFGGCSTTAGVTTCTFNGNPLSLTTVGNSGPSTLVSNVLNIPIYSGGGNTQCFLGITGLVGAYTDGSGIIKQALCLGNGPSSYTVPSGATQLQLGINDNLFNDNTGSFTINVSKNGGAASPVTVGGTVMPWSPTANPSFNYGQNDGAAPVVALTGLVSGDVLTITYASGTVACHSGGCPPTDANGWLTSPPGPASQGGPTGIFANTWGFFPTLYMGPASVGSVVTSINGNPGAFTFSGAGVSCSGTTCTFSGSGGGGSGTVSGQASGVVPLGTNATTIGNQSHIDDGNTTAGHVTISEPTDFTGTVHGVTLPHGTAVSGVAGAAVLSSDATNGYAEVNENNTGLSRICTAGNSSGVAGCASGGGSVNWKASWSGSSAYSVGDTVYYNGTIYIAKNAIAAPGASPSFVQAILPASGNTLTATVTGGHLLLFDAIPYSGCSSFALPPTDTQGNTWTQIATTTGTPFAGNTQYTWAARASASGSMTISVPGTCAQINMAFAEFANASTTANVTASFTNGGSSTVTWTPSITTSVTTLIVNFGVNNQSNQTFSGVGGMTIGGSQGTSQFGESVVAYGNFASGSYTNGTGSAIGYSLSGGAGAANGANSVVAMVPQTINPTPDTDPFTWQVSYTPPVTGAEVVTFSATPTFSAATLLSQITMTGNITSFSLASGVPGQNKTLCFIQDGTGSRTVAAPANVHGFFTVGSTASKANCQHFTYSNSASAWLADSAGAINQ